MKTGQNQVDPFHQEVFPHHLQSKDLADHEIIGGEQESGKNLQKGKLRALAPQLLHLCPYRSQGRDLQGPFSPVEEDEKRDHGSRQSQKKEHQIDEKKGPLQDHQGGQKAEKRKLGEAVQEGVPVGLLGAEKAGGIKMEADMERQNADPQP